MISIVAMKNDGKSQAVSSTQVLALHPKLIRQIRIPPAHFSDAKFDSHICTNKMSLLFAGLLFDGSPCLWFPRQAQSE